MFPHAPSHAAASPVRGSHGTTSGPSDAMAVGQGEVMRIGESKGWKTIPCGLKMLVFWALTYNFGDDNHQFQLNPTKCGSTKMRDMITPRIWTFMKYNGEMTAALQLDFAAVLKWFCWGLQTQHSVYLFDRDERACMACIQLVWLYFLGCAIPIHTYTCWLHQILSIGSYIWGWTSPTSFLNSRRWNNISRSCEAKSVNSCTLLGVELRARVFFWLDATLVKLSCNSPLMLLR